MLTIHPLPAFSDNYIWLIEDAQRRHCVAVDPGQAAPVLGWLEAHPGYQLSALLITHEHPDHTGGITELKAAYPQCRVIGPADLAGIDEGVHDGQTLSLLDYPLNVLAVPGHTPRHLAYLLEDGQRHLFSGDTLFAAGCGRLFGGTAQQLHHSLQRLAALPGDTLVYCAHEYTLSNLRFAAAVEPDNPAVLARLEAVSRLREAGGISLPSNLALELETNPFLRLHSPHVQASLQQHWGELPAEAEARFALLRRWKDVF